MKPCDISLEMQIKDITEKRTVVIIDDSFKLIYPMCWLVQMLDGILTFCSKVNVNMDQYCERDSQHGGRIYRHRMWIDKDMERFYSNPVTIEYGRDSFWPLSSERFTRVKAYMKYFKGFEVV